MPVILLAHVDDDHQPAATLLLDIVVRRMVRDVAMDQPFAGALGLPDDIVALSGPTLTVSAMNRAFCGIVSPSRATTWNGPPWMCIGWMKPMFVPMKRSLSAFHGSSAPERGSDPNDPCGADGIA